MRLNHCGIQSLETAISAMETMEISDDLHSEIVTVKRSLFDEGFLHLSQFLQLEMLQDGDNPNFVREVFCLYFEDMRRQFSEIEQILQKELIGKQRLDMNRFLHRLKGSVVSIGALKIVNEVNKMREYFEEDNMEGIIAAFELVKEECENLRVKLEPYFQLMGQVGSSIESEAPK